MSTFIQSLIDALTIINDKTIEYYLATKKLGKHELNSSNLWDIVIEFMTGRPRQFETVFVQYLQI